ncbi:OLC1v1034701C1 [Oldenlandia corymbosa var. corymbosa]|uniref:OLC1v1034701C1 n=1 Tax=Oldenlandia corymbosa var. corymbosa TaxID=529605 RepID=A0AAV1CRW3_OLDCO|nr:OLC1v1034701C1 [Oldenlandia corymbosa var. corymbosa]
MRFAKAAFPKTLPESSSSNVHQAFRTFLNFRPVDHHRIDYNLFAKLIRRCTERHLVRQAKQLHARFVLSSTLLDNFLASQLINFYSKNNHLREAHHVFDQIPSKNTFSWNALLIGYSQRNYHNETLSLFRSFLRGVSNSLSAKPDGFSLTCALKALAGLSCDSLLVNIVHCYVVKSGTDSDVFVPNALLTCYSRSDDMVSARCLFDEMSNRDLVSWTSLISGYSQAGFYEESKKLYRRLLALEGVRPNGPTLVSVLQACAQSNDLILGMEVHKYVIENDIEMDVTLCNSIISLYAKCGSLDYARDLFDEMSEKDEITYGAIISGYMAYGFIAEALEVFRAIRDPVLSTWNAIISGHVKNNQFQGALDFFREMLEFGCRPSIVTISSILAALSHLSDLKVAKEIHAYAIKHDYDDNVYVATGIVDNYAKFGFISGAKTVFVRTRDRSVVIWTAIISGYAAQGDAGVALYLFNEMLNEGLQPDPVTFTALLGACARAGLVEEAWFLFRSLVPNYGIEPVAEHYACMVGILSRAGKLSEALEFIREMPVEPDAKTWGALLNGALLSGNLEIGKFISDQLSKMDTEVDANHFLLVNLYSKVGKWKEAEVLRKEIQNVGLKKVAGSSWIES